MRSPLLSLLFLLLLLLPLSIASFSPNPELVEGQRDRKVPAERHRRGRKQECRCEDVFQNTHGGKRVRVAKPPSSHCPCDHLKYKRKNLGLGHQKHRRQSCLRFLKQCQLRDMVLPL
ncbi:C-X-C motif chemokine 17 [Dromiciops gliroides]|uniref:C-X-C motif chemokine 17 n=1 Tax=Dromiciops gliroides TaxID=33562 RepID=UPI001CC41A8B|nr:C-X-C motif chemokine 17 [Dromiciops gliroides]